MGGWAPVCSKAPGPCVAVAQPTLVGVKAFGVNCFAKAASMCTPIARAMKKVLLAAVGVFACALFTGCGTVNAVRWSYGDSSCFDQPDADVVRPVCAVPLIVGGVAFDGLTWPIQLAFGVWPWWGAKSMVHCTTATPASCKSSSPFEAS